MLQLPQLVQGYLSVQEDLQVQVVLDLLEHLVTLVVQVVLYHLWNLVDLHFLVFQEVQAYPKNFTFILKFGY